MAVTFSEEAEVRLCLLREKHETRSHRLLVRRENHEEPPWCMGMCIDAFASAGSILAVNPIYALYDLTPEEIAIVEGKG